MVNDRKPVEKCPPADPRIFPFWEFSKNIYEQIDRSYSANWSFTALGLWVHFSYIKRKFKEKIYKYSKRAFFLDENCAKTHIQI